LRSSAGPTPWNPPIAEAMPSFGTPSDARAADARPTRSAFCRPAVARRTVIATGELVEPKTSSVVPAGSAAAIRPSNATAGPTAVA
jgi:hypothetical protein